VGEQLPATPSTRSFFAADVKGVERLAGLALDLHWSWSHRTDDIWERLDAALWERTRNPWIVLQSVSRERLEEALADPAFVQAVDDLLESSPRALAAPAWFQTNHPQVPLNRVAYFSMEFMLGPALPIYSGGLGNVAGDQLKAASDLGVPVVGVGLLYQQGYFRQAIDRDGNQQALFPYNDPGQLPITPLRRPNGEWLRVEIALPGRSMWLRAWQAQVGRTQLYLLDSNDAANTPADRGITSELYGGGPDVRLMQEVALGIGGWRLLATLGSPPDVCHLNEGHPALAVLERARHFMVKERQPFDVALAVTRAGNLFTTHTAVAAGCDRFAPSLVEQYLGSYARHDLQITLDELLALGRRAPNDSTEPFNMAFLAIRGSGAVNGVSRLHGTVSRRLFQPLFPRWPEAEVPIGHVTNGVHTPTWDSEAADDLWTEAAGKERWLADTETLEHDIRRVSDARLWAMRRADRTRLVEYARHRLSRQLAEYGAPSEAVERAKTILDPDVLTLGFARRFATYKRPNLLLHDPPRLLRLLSDPARPAQLILAGKAHPADEAGRALIRQWLEFIRRPEARGHVIFLSDYDALLSEHLVQGVDVWINTPRRPWEACGTSGMKVLVNGGLNLSELDGWWAEAYSRDVGWALGDGEEHGDDPSWDASEAGTLYDLLERELIPEFYQHDSNGLPHAWIGRIRESMARLTPFCSANRSVREYTDRYYVPAAAAYRERAADNGAAGAEIVAWRRTLDRQWPAVHFGTMTVETAGGMHTFSAQVCGRDLVDQGLRVELYAEGIGGRGPVRQEMTRGHQVAGLPDCWLFSARVPADRPASDHTVRVIPQHAGVAIPLEEPRILWQR
jgi:glycogen phosphorylase